MPPWIRYRNIQYNINPVNKSTPAEIFQHENPGAGRTAGHRGLICVIALCAQFGEDAVRHLPAGDERAARGDVAGSVAFQKRPLDGGFHRIGLLG